MTLTRSGPSLDGLLSALDAFADGTVAHDVAVALAQAGQGLVRRGFAESKAPDGRRWAPLKRPRPGGPVLVKTRRLSAAAALYTVDRSGFVFERVDALTRYGRFHQGGAPGAHLPARPFYPTDPLPLGWALSLSAAADAAARTHLPR